jgi:serine/threonine protein kinase
MPENIGPGVMIKGTYRLEEKIGNSHLGEIYLGTRDGGEPVTVEILAGSMTSDEETVTRFLQEVEILSSLRHPSLLAAIEAGQDTDTYFLVTAYEHGMVSLNEYLAQHKALEPAQALGFMESIAGALEYTWSEGKILHRDIKPQNIYITADGQARLGGFAIAKSSESQSMGLTGVGFTIGTPEYMSPEQIRTPDDLDFRSDLYSLGVVLYECLVGELPFVEQAPLLLMQKHMDEEPQPLIERTSRVSPQVSALVDRMLAKDRDDRYESWGALISALQVAASGRTRQTKTPKPQTKRTVNTAQKGANSQQHISERVIKVSQRATKIHFPWNRV